MGVTGLAWAHVTGNLFEQCTSFKIFLVSQIWWFTPLIPSLRRQRKAALHHTEASLTYMASSRPGRARQQSKYCLGATLNHEQMKLT